MTPTFDVLTSACLHTQMDAAHKTMINVNHGECRKDSSRHRHEFSGQPHQPSRRDNSLVLQFVHSPIALVCESNSSPPQART
jgi:hypothetical protein